MNFKENLLKPVLFMVFNRPEKTNLVWEQIKKAKPIKLYISSDAPRDTHPEDKKKVEKVRKIIKNVDWDCSVKYLFHKENLGCSLAGKTAFDWVFSQEEEMIELEDDTVPSQSFFWFCQEMLERYKDNEKIGYITGQNFMGIKSGYATYFFSHYFGSSGWGTWKRIYEQWDYKLEALNESAYNHLFIKNFDSKFEYQSWLRKFEYHRNIGSNTYDLQSIFLIFRNDLLNIIPNKNLITNIGFDLEGSNFNGGIDKFANKDRFELDEIIHPFNIARNKEIDKSYFKYHFMGRSKLSYLLRWKFGPYYRKYIKK